MLSYQKLDVYRCPIQFIALVALLIGKLPRGYFFLTDELKRASVSMPQNLAEGVLASVDVDVGVLVDVDVVGLFIVK